LRDAEEEEEREGAAGVTATATAGLTVAGAVTALRRTSPETAAIVLTYFVQGVLGLSRLAVSFFLKDELQISPSMVRYGCGVLRSHSRPALPLGHAFGSRHAVGLVGRGRHGSLATGCCFSPLRGRTAPVFNFGRAPLPDCSSPLLKRVGGGGRWRC